MPTNKLWIEHTERAAWQSVQALREKLAEAEARAERLAPPVEGWRELLDALDQARVSHALSGGTYAELIRGAVDRLARAEAERRSLEAQRAGDARVPSQVRAPEPRRRRERAPAWNDDDDERRPSPDERRLVGEIQRRARELEAERPRPDFDRRLHEIETRLADLPELDPGEVLDIAADLGAIALRLRPSTRDDDDD